MGQYIMSKPMNKLGKDIASGKNPFHLKYRFKNFILQIWKICFETYYMLKWKLRAFTYNKVHFLPQLPHDGKDDVMEM